MAESRKEKEQELLSIAELRKEKEQEVISIGRKKKKERTRNPRKIKTRKLF